ncbi:hypothetical protein GCM10007052_28010 [Halioglobus japonicus]|nr:hypothetical protein GCM10007052_28010 [Halioglobus japonicus]
MQTILEGVIWRPWQETEFTSENTLISGHRNYNLRGTKVASQLADNAGYAALQGA